VLRGRLCENAAVMEEVCGAIGNLTFSQVGRDRFQDVSSVFRSTIFRHKLNVNHKL